MHVVIFYVEFPNVRGLFVDDYNEKCDSGQFKEHTDGEKYNRDPVHERTARDRNDYDVDDDLRSGND